MVVDPLKHIEKFVNAGSDIIIFHVESESDILATINKVKSYNKSVGIALNPGTDIKKIISYLHLVDLVLVMTVEPGACGQKFIIDQIFKIQNLSRIIKSKNLNVTIEVDGGINLAIARMVSKYGVTSCVSGSYIFNSNNIASVISDFKLVDGV